MIAAESKAVIKGLTRKNVSTRRAIKIPRVIAFVIVSVMPFEGKIIL
jgi:hypothetical protein